MRVCLTNTFFTRREMILKTLDFITIYVTSCELLDGSFLVCILDPFPSRAFPIL